MISMEAEKRRRRPAGGSGAPPLDTDRKEPEDGLLETVRRFATDRLAGARGSHAWDHTLRVLTLCERIGRVEGADMTVLRVAALLHDIGRSRQDASGGSVCHAVKGAELAQPVISGLALSVA